MLFYNISLTLILTLLPWYILQNQKEKFFLNLIFLIHFLAFLIHFYYRGYFPSDVNGYFRWAQDHSYNSNNIIGTGFIIEIVKFFFKINIIEFNISLIFSLVSLIGFILIYRVINKYNNTLFLKFIFLFPSWHFYTAATGKEALIVFTIGLTITFFDKKNIIFLIFSILFFYMVRPQVALLFSSLILILMSEKVFSFYTKSIKLKKNPIFISIFISIFIIFLIFLFVNFFWSDILLMYQNFEYVILNRLYIEEGNTSYGADNINLILKVIYYLFYPIAFNFEKNFFYNFAVIENLILILLLITLCYFSIISFRYKKIKLFNVNSLLLLFIICYIISIAFINTNIGLAMRQKWMILPFIIYIFSIFLKKFRL